MKGTARKRAAGEEDDNDLKDPTAQKKFVVPNDIKPSVKGDSSTPEQQAIYDFVQNGQGNAIVEARAGSGKSFVLGKLLSKIAPQKNVLVLTFNTANAEEMEKKAKGFENVTVCTVNGYGLRMLRENDVECQIVKGKTWTLARKLAKEGKKKGDPWKVEAEALRKLCVIVQSTLDDSKELLALAKDVLPDVNDQTLQQVVAKLPKLIQNKETMREISNEIDFDDQIWLPHKLNLQAKTLYDFVFVDECQDLTKAQIDLVRKSMSPTGRLIAIGDQKQAIYSWRGANNAFDEWERVMFQGGAKRTKRYFPLNICFRCPRSHIALAQAIVPEIVAKDNAPAGEIIEGMTLASALDRVSAGDLVIARNNKHSIAFAFELVSKGQAAKIAGETVLKERLLEFISETSAKTIDALIASAASAKEKEAKQLAKVGDDTKIIFTDALFKFITAYAKRFDSVEAFQEKIRSIFLDDDNWAAEAVVCSSIHRAKGETVNRVFILADGWINSLKNGKKKKAIEEEKNLLYISLTRSTHLLGFVGASSKELLKEVIREQT